MHVPGVPDLVHRGVEGLHGRVDHHVGGVLGLDQLVGAGQTPVHVSLVHPGSADFGIRLERPVFLEQPLQRDIAVRSRIPFDLKRLGGTHRGRERLRNGDHPAGALAEAVVHGDRLDVAGNGLRLAVVDG